MHDNYESYDQHEGCTLEVISAHQMSDWARVDDTGKLLLLGPNHGETRQRYITTLHCLRHDVQVTFPEHLRFPNCEDDCDHEIGVGGVITMHESGFPF